MSKRLNKRQQRLEEEAAQLKTLQQVDASDAEGEEEEEEELVKEETEGSKGGNVFAALNAGNEDQDEDESEEEPEQMIDAPKKKKNNKKKKKKRAPNPSSDPFLLDVSSTAVSTPGTAPASNKNVSEGKEGGGKKAKKPEMEMDELDRALAEIREKFGEEDRAQAGSSSKGNADSEGPMSSAGLALRGLLSIDAKHLDADAELRKFFGAKVVSSATSSSSSKRAPHSLLKTTLAKPRPNWPPPNSFLGLGMRELNDTEVAEKRSRIGTKGLRESAGGREKWFSFEHGGGWREAQRQFLGAISSHDPNQLYALLQVFPYHTDCILQMGEVYRQQAGSYLLTMSAVPAHLSQASEFIDRALFAFERAFSPGFNIGQGNSRLDFDRVENRGFFLALIRNLQFLGRRGCWSTSFTFAKLLLAMDPHQDPQGSLLWLDFLSLKSNNPSWLLSLLSSWDAGLSDFGWKDEKKDREMERIRLSALPGMGWARALAMRMEEVARKDKNHEGSSKALKEAIMTFPYVLPLLADKVGFSLPPEALNHPLLELRLGNDASPLTTLHLLSHIYALRSQALWKEAPTLAWLQSQLPLILPDLLSPSNQSYPPREAALAQYKSGMPEWVVRHVMVAEDNSTLLGFLEGRVKERMGMSYDPLPPRTSVSAYNNDYFSGVIRRRNRNAHGRSGNDGQDDDNDDEGNQGFIQGLMASLMNFGAGAGAPAGPAADGEEETGMLRAFGARLREIFQAGGEATDEEREAMMEQVFALAEGVRAQRGGGPLPGGFPGQEGEEEREWEDDEVVEGAGGGQEGREGR